MSDNEIEQSATSSDQANTPAAVEAVAPPNFSVGATLREGRDRLNLDLSQVAGKLRIRQPFLVALEEGRFKDLPGGTYAIGFLRSYSEFLGLDGEEMVRRFRQEAADALTVHAELQFPSPVSEGRMPSAPVLLLGLAAALVAYGLWLGVASNRNSGGDLIPAVPERLTTLLNQPAAVGTNPMKPVAEPVTVPAPVAEPAPVVADNTPAPPPVAEAVVQPAVPAAPAPVPVPMAAPVVPAPASVPAAPAPVPAPVSAADVPVNVTAASRVVIKAIADESWIQIRESDGQLVVSRLLHKGDVYTVPDRPDLTLTTGNAGTLQIAVDDKTLPPLGSNKQVRHNISLDPVKPVKRAKGEAAEVTPETAAPVVAAPVAPAPAPAPAAEAAKPKPAKAHKDKEKADKDKAPVKSDAPKSEAPPKADASPKADAPKTGDAPKADAPKGDEGAAPKAEAPKPQQ